METNGLRNYKLVKKGNCQRDRQVDGLSPELFSVESLQAIQLRLL